MILSTSLNSTSYSFIDKLKAVDYFLIIIVAIIGSLSVFSIYSTESGNFSFYTKNHLIRFMVFFSMFLILSFIRVSAWYRQAYIFYILGILLLLFVMFFGISASGSKRWINLFIMNLQPSELMKIAVIVCFARYYHRIQSSDIQSYKYLLQPIILLLIPCYLVITQPDLGTAILIAGSGLVIIWLAGLNLKYFVYSGLILLVSLPFVISILKPYQKSRILTFFNPERDPLGAGYQIIQSKIAIGSGGFLGKGFLQGTQSYLEFLPEKHTDFIFTLFSEEFGFVGSIILIFLYALLIYRIIRIGFLSRSFFAKLYCFGFASALFLYIFVNIAMVLGLLPIVGAPLPIMSYGGSSMLSIMLGLSIVMSCKIYSRDPIGS
ncbi:rod shape-determining protein RodA [Pelagibacterales bacterium SAG-MED17]|nr:rod shape-determining protein RodA [Pelagibacterales bacterium SAG-MED17]